MGALERSIGRSVAAYRRRVEMTQAQLAERVGVTRETIGRLETGAAIPSLARLDDIARAVGVEMHLLLRGDAGNVHRDAALDRLLHTVASRSPAEIDLVTAIAGDLLDHLGRTAPASGTASPTEPGGRIVRS